MAALIPLAAILLVLLNAHQIHGDAEIGLALAKDNIEIVGFLDSEGSIAIDDLLVTGSEDYTAAGEDDAPTALAAQASNSTADYASWLSSHSKSCSSISPHWIPCLEEEEDSACKQHRIQNPCLVPLPRGYMRPEAWPSSIHKVRVENLGDGDRARTIKLRGGKASSFKAHELDVAKKRVDQLIQLLPDLDLGRKTRLVLNLEAGAGGLSVELDKYGVLVLSVAARNSKGDAVQVIVERGYPAMVESLGSFRLPYPSEAFDLVHCASCNIQWARKGGLYLLEADRILHRGGYFVWINSSGKEKSWSDMLNVAANMCWTLYLRKDKLAIWQKPLDDTCYQFRNHRSFCDNGTSPDDAWKVPLQLCLSGPSKSGTFQKMDWPTRLLNATHRLNGLARTSFRLATVEAYEADLNYWKMLTDFYLTSLGPFRIRELRNILDTNAGYGGFAAALALKTPALPWWVLNVSPVDNAHNHNHLANIFDRGLIGVYHDWCSALNMYPRAFDLVHASRLFSRKHNCSMLVIVTEIDRLLRPGGFAIFRDDIGTLNEVTRIARTLQWKTTIQDTDSGPQGKDKVMHCQKTSWRPS